MTAHATPDFLMLGPLEIRAGDRSLGLGTTKQRVVLAALLADVGRPLTVESLVDRVWDDEPPAKARAVLQAHLSRIRGLMSELDSVDGRRPAVLRRSGGYLVDVDPDRVDRHLFRRLLAEAHVPHVADDTRVELLDRALVLWRGEPLADVPGAWAANVREHLRRQYVDAVVLWGRAQVATGGAAAAVDLLREVSTANPNAEGVAAVLMHALHRTGRAAEALDCFAAVRRRLAEDLGTDPGVDLMAAHRAVLGTLRSVSKAPEPAPAPPAAPARRRPAMLPASIAHFTGRDEELDALDALARTAASGTAVPVLALVGPAGVGKTALAVQWGQRAVPGFPDGQLFVDLRGFSATRPLRPLEALGRLLAALGEPAADLPTELDDAVARYRSLMAGRRLLVVLDNARDAAQVLPLVPGSPGCLVVVTSRRRLTGLVAQAAARRLVLPHFSVGPAVELLGRILSEERIEQEPEAARALVRVCGHLPLALTIAAANLAEWPDRSLADYVTELTSRSRLAALRIDGDDTPAPRAMFDLTYATLDATQQRLFRRLGLFPGADFGADVAAAMAGVTVEQATAILERLADVHLVRRQAGDRFSVHDLLAEYGRVRVAEVPADGADATLDRLCDHYAMRCEAAAHLMYPQALRLGMRPGREPVVVPGMDAITVVSWLQADLPNVLAVVALAAERRHRAAYLIVDSLRRYLGQRRNVHDWEPAARSAAAVADAVGDLPARATAQLGLGDMLDAKGDRPAAVIHYRAALDLTRQAAWPQAEATVLGNLGTAYLAAGELDAARECFGQALALHRANGTVAGEAVAAGNLGLLQAMAGELDAAVEVLNHAVAVHRAHGATATEALMLCNLADAHLERDDLDAAHRAAGAALDLSRRAGRLDATVFALLTLAHVAAARGRLVDATGHVEQARTAFGASGAPEVEAQIRLASATVALAAGDAPSAVEQLRAGLLLADAPVSYLRVRIQITLASAYGRAGHQELARQHAGQAADLARAAGYRLLATRASALVAGLQAVRVGDRE